MTETKLSEFQRDLLAGYTIAEALERHGLTFKYVCDTLPKAPRKPKRRRRHRR